jgi:hypothetical protein
VGLHHLLLARGFDALGQMPPGLGEMWALEDGQRCSEANGGRGIRVIKKVAEGFHRAGGQVAHAVLESFDIFALGFLQGGLEFGLRPEPVVNCGAVNAGVPSCVGGGASLSKGGYDLGLDGRQVCIGNCVGFR